MRFRRVWRRPYPLVHMSHPLLHMSHLASDAGPNWAEIVTGVGTIIIAAGVFFTGWQVWDSRKARTTEIARLLAERWESPELVKARKLIEGTVPPNADEAAHLRAVEQLKENVKAAKDGTEADPGPSDHFYLYTHFINFFEQLGVSFKKNRHGTRVVDELLGSTVTDWWATWKQVIPHVWGERSRVGENFGLLADAIARRRRPRASLWSRLGTPFRWIGRKIRRRPARPAATS